MVKSSTVKFAGAHGYQLAGRIDIPVGPPLGWALFAHCFTCSKQSRAALRVSKGLAERGIGVLRFDFTGLGESDGDFETTDFSGNVADLVAAAKWMQETGRSPSLLAGHSLGGAAVIVAAREIEGLKAVATINAPSDAGHVIHQFSDDLETIESEGTAEVQLAGRPFRITKEFVDDVRDARVAAAVRDLDLPLLVLHGPRDEVVGIENASALFTSARHPKNFISLDGADHFLRRPEDSAFAASMIAAWAGHYMSDSSQPAPVEGVARMHEVIVRETGEASRFQNEVFVDGRRYLIDEPQSVGGSNTGPTPYDLLAAALGGCTSMTLRMYADRKKWPLDRVTVRLGHRKVHADDCETCDNSDRIDEFSRVLEIEGELDAEQVERLVEIADRCPVHRTLEHGVIVKTALEGQ